MSAVLWVGLGGALGSIGRYLLSGWVTQQVTGRFPAGTLTVNVLGCLGIGILAGLAVKEEYFSHAARLFPEFDTSEMESHNSLGHRTCIFEFCRFGCPALMLRHVCQEKA